MRRARSQREGYLRLTSCISPLLASLHLVRRLQASQWGILTASEQVLRVAVLDGLLKPSTKSGVDTTDYTCLQLHLTVRTILNPRDAECSCPT